MLPNQFGFSKQYDPNYNQLENTFNPYNNNQFVKPNPIYDHQVRYNKIEPECTSTTQLGEIKSSLDLVRQELINLRSSSDQILTDFESHSELMLTFIDTDKLGTKLLLTGLPKGSPQEITKLLGEHLHLQNIPVTGVTEIETGLVFQVTNAADKIRILTRRSRLRSTGLAINHYADPADLITTTTEEVLDVDVRFGENK